MLGMVRYCSSMTVQDYLAITTSPLTDFFGLKPRRRSRSSSSISSIPADLRTFSRVIEMYLLLSWTVFKMSPFFCASETQTLEYGLVGIRLFLFKIRIPYSYPVILYNIYHKASIQAVNSCQRVMTGYVIKV